MSTFYAPPVRPAAKAAFDKIQKQQHCPHGTRVKTEPGDELTQRQQKQKRKHAAQDALHHSSISLSTTRTLKSFASSFSRHLTNAYEIMQEEEKDAQEFLQAQQRAATTKSSRGRPSKTEQMQMTASSSIDFTDYLLSSRNLEWLRGMDRPACGLFLAKRSTRKLIPFSHSDKDAKELIEDDDERTDAKRDTKTSSRKKGRQKRCYTTKKARQGKRNGLSYICDPSAHLQTVRLGHSEWTFSVTDGSMYPNPTPVYVPEPWKDQEQFSQLPRPQPEDAARRSAFTLCRKLRLRIKESTKKQLITAIKSHYGEMDKYVLELCESGQMNPKVELVESMQNNFTMFAKDDILANEPLGVYISTLRETSSQNERVGEVDSILHVWSYRLDRRFPTIALPENYAGPDLLFDASEYGNETRFFRDSKWTKDNTREHNCEVRPTWNYKTGLPYLVVCAVIPIKKGSELFIDWSAPTWRRIWQVQLRAAASVSHTAHLYLHALQKKLKKHNLPILPPETDTSNPVSTAQPEQPMQGLTTASPKKQHSHKNSTAELTEEKKNILQSGADLADKNAKDTIDTIPHLESAPVYPPSFGNDLAKASTTNLTTTTSSNISNQKDCTTTQVSQSSPSIPENATPAPPNESKKKINVKTRSRSEVKKTISFCEHRAFSVLTSYESSMVNNVLSCALTREIQKEQQRVKQRVKKFLRYRHFFRLLTEKEKKFVLKRDEYIAKIRQAQHTNYLNSLSSPFRAHMQDHNTLPGSSLKATMPTIGHPVFEPLANFEEAYTESGCQFTNEPEVDLPTQVRKQVTEAFEHHMADRKRTRLSPTEKRLLATGLPEKCDVFRIISLLHPARFLTRPDQSAFALVATERINSARPFVNYVGRLTDWQTFHRGDDKYARSQVFAIEINRNDFSDYYKNVLNGPSLEIESLHKGNAARFANDDFFRRGKPHETVNADASIGWDEVRGIPCIILKTLRDRVIQQGEEIILNYGHAFWDKVARSLLIDHREYGDSVGVLIHKLEQILIQNDIKLPRRRILKMDRPVLKRRPIHCAHKLTDDDLSSTDTDDELLRKQKNSDSEDGGDDGDYDGEDENDHEHKPVLDDSKLVDPLSLAFPDLPSSSFSHVHGRKVVFASSYAHRKDAVVYPVKFSYLPEGHSDQDDYTAEENSMVEAEFEDEEEDSRAEQLTYDNDIREEDLEQEMKRKKSRKMRAETKPSSSSLKTRSTSNAKTAPKSTRNKGKKKSSSSSNSHSSQADKATTKPTIPLGRASSKIKSEPANTVTVTKTTTAATSSSNSTSTSTLDSTSTAAADTTTTNAHESRPPRVMKIEKWVKEKQDEMRDQEETSKNSKVKKMKLNHSNSHIVSMSNLSSSSQALDVQSRPSTSSSSSVSSPIAKAAPSSARKINSKAKSAAASNRKITSFFTAKSPNQIQSLIHSSN